MIKQGCEHQVNGECKSASLIAHDQTHVNMVSILMENREKKPHEIWKKNVKLVFKKSWNFEVFRIEIVEFEILPVCIKKHQSVLYYNFWHHVINHYN